MKRLPHILLGLLAVSLVVGVAVWWHAMPSSTSAVESGGARTSSRTATQAAHPRPAVAPSPPDPALATVLPADSDGVTSWPAAVAVAATLNDPTAEPAADLEIVQGVLADYLRVLGEVPPGGENEEITRGLMGDNPKRVRFLPERPGLLDGEGRLLDRWGTPYDFHKISGRRIDLRSAGPDRRLRTPDDLVAEGPGSAPTL